MSSLNCSDLPNPFTAMAFLSPRIAYQEQVSSYILVGTAGAMVWDILSNVHNDYRLLFESRVGLPTVAYFVSRVAALFFVLISTIFDSAPVGHCSAFQKAVNISFPVAASATSLLFFFRVRAVYSGNNLITLLFFCLWLSVLGGSLVLIDAVTATTIGPTNYCIDDEIKLSAGAAAITPLIHDTLVFVAISWRLSMISYVEDNPKTRAKAFLYGKYLPAFSRTLLRDGQLYYLITVGSNLLTVVMIYMSAVPVPYRTMFPVPNVMLTNAMACHVFRSTKLGVITEDGTAFGDTQDLLPLTFRRGERNDVDSRIIVGPPKVAHCARDTSPETPCHNPKHDFPV
ncbi:hypothetical protein BV22DRAFT_1090750 [Leucogyrophana mollusca]|uniref:Uncharacterized protein n=1 Tax=Leucogyrophana mollusca TaxID=85980 RepID=A0ACB8BFB5_9AGAM|nr:hypothetical protein BV22DRAFT_1090750 [Leucogyrophana mollusca]